MGPKVDIKAMGMLKPRVGIIYSDTATHSNEVSQCLYFACRSIHAYILYVYFYCVKIHVHARIHISMQIHILIHV